MYYSVQYLSVIFYCQDQRHSILRCLSKTARLADDVDLSELAKRSVNFTGADLRALLFNAQLAAVHEVQAAHSQVHVSHKKLWSYCVWVCLYRPTAMIVYCVC